MRPKITIYRQHLSLLTLNSKLSGLFDIFQLYNRPEALAPAEVIGFWASIQAFDWILDERVWHHRLRVQSCYSHEYFAYYLLSAICRVYNYKSNHLVAGNLQWEGNRSMTSFPSNHVSITMSSMWSSAGQMRITAGMKMLSSHRAINSWLLKVFGLRTTPAVRRTDFSSFSLANLLFYN